MKSKEPDALVQSATVMRMDRQRFVFQSLSSMTLLCSAGSGSVPVVPAGNWVVVQAVGSSGSVPGLVAAGSWALAGGTGAEPGANNRPVTGNGILTRFAP